MDGLKKGKERTRTGWDIDSIQPHTVIVRDLRKTVGQRLQGDELHPRPSTCPIISETVRISNNNGKANYKVILTQHLDTGGNHKHSNACQATEEGRRWQTLPSFEPRRTDVPSCSSLVAWRKHHSPMQLQMWWLREGFHLRHRPPTTRCYKSRIPISTPWYDYGWKPLHRHPHRRHLRTKETRTTHMQRGLSRTAVIHTRHNRTTKKERTTSASVKQIKASNSKSSGESRYTCRATSSRSWAENDEAATTESSARLVKRTKSFFNTEK